MPKLLMVTTVPGTLRAFLLPFAEHFSASGWRVDAMAHGVTSSPECVQTFDRVWEVPWSRDPRDLRNVLQAPRTIRAIVERERYDLVHVHTPVAAFATRYALSRSPLRDRTAVIYTAHGFHFYRGGATSRNLLFRSLEKLAGRWTDYLVVINEEDEAAARRHGIVAPDRLVHMPGIGVDTERYSPAQVSEEEVAGVRASLGLAPGLPLFLVVAEMIPRKRHQDVLHAFARLSQSDAHLAFAGEGPRMASLRRLATELGVAGRVHFLGRRSDVPTLARAANAVLLVSRQEGLPRSVMEALSLEVPVIGSDIRGIRDLLDDGSGLLVPVGDVDRLAASMRWVLEHPVAATAMALRGRQKVCAGFGQAAIIDAHEALYARALRAARRERADRPPRPHIAGVPAEGGD
ncbi:MAG: glycosyltransferase family 4 protein [Thermomicrobiales bacterium]